MAPKHQKVSQVPKIKGNLVFPQIQMPKIARLAKGNLQKLHQGREYRENLYKKYTNTVKGNLVQKLHKYSE